MNAHKPSLFSVLRPRKTGALCAKGKEDDQMSELKGVEQIAKPPQEPVASVAYWEAGAVLADEVRFAQSLNGANVGRPLIF